MSKCFIVLGFYRSGTSLVAGLLDKLGVYMGKNFIPPAPDNPKGFFESKDLIKINNEILVENGGNFHHPKPVHGVSEMLDTKMVNYITDNEQTLWGMKDPRLCCTLPAWLPLITNPFLILVGRNPDEIIDSFKRRQIVVDVKDFPDDLKEIIRMMIEYDAQLVRCLNICKRDGMKVMHINTHEAYYDPLYYVKKLINYVHPLTELVDFIDKDILHCGSGERK